MFNKALCFTVAGWLFAMAPTCVLAAGVLPSAPTNVTATASNGSATVTFIPSSIGSGTLVIYWAACGVDTTHLVIAKGSNSPITVTGLTNGTVYYCWALTESTVGYSSNWSTASNKVTPTSTPVASVQVVEFYNTNLDNYFITADAYEAAAIDNGSAGPGWSRTGNTFKSGGSTSVCRFYGSQSPGPNSHFYTVDAGECASLKQLQASTPATQKRWNFESLDFVSTPVSSNGTCPNGTVPVYRAYNNGFTRGVDSNHRITTNLTAIQQVVACGWNNEGTVMCATSGTSSGGTTSCGSSGGGTPAPSGSYGQFDSKLFVDSLFMSSTKSIKLGDYAFLTLPFIVLASTITPDNMINGVVNGNPDIATKITNGMKLDFGKGYYLPGTRLSGSVSMTYSNKVNSTNRTTMNYVLGFANFYRDWKYLADGSITGLLDLKDADLTMTLGGTIHSATGDIAVSGSFQFIESDNCSNPSAGSIDFVSSSKREKITFTKKCDGTYDYATY